MGNLVVALRALGHDAVVLSPVVDGTADLARPTSMAELADAGFWREADVDAVIAVTWMWESAVTAAAREAGVVALALADSDGTFVPWHHPRTFARRMLSIAQTRGGGGPPARSPEAQIARTPRGLAEPPATPLVRKLAVRRRLRAAIAAASWTGLPGGPALRDARRSLERLGIEVAAGRLGVYEEPTAPHFTTGPLDATRRRAVVAIGRWDDPVKDPRLLAAVVRGVIAADSEVDVTIVGRAADRIVPRVDRVRAIESLPNKDLPALLSRASVLVSTSRSEAAAMVYGEALSCGCAVVGPPINAVEHIASGTGGWRSPSRRPRDLVRTVRAALDETASNPEFAARIADHWRPRLDSRAVAGKLVERIERISVEEP